MTVQAKASLMRKVILFSVVSLLGAFYLLIPVTKPAWVYGVARWLNAYDQDNAFLLDAARTMLAISLFIGMTNIVRLIVKFPRARRFYLLAVPFPFAMFYYVVQITTADPDFLPRNGFIFINAAATLLFAGYAVVAGLLAYYYREEAGDLRRSRP